jgi:SAM-dependent methyltransferase
MATLVQTSGSNVSSTSTSRYAPLLYGITVVWSACLLFLVEPLASKLILPWFGGSAAVWITCLLFFQSALLLGYLYAHAATRLLAPRWQAILHCVLLVSSLTALPILPNPRWQPPPGSDPTWYVLLVLAASVGLPYTLLSSTSPLVQCWFARRKAGELPYRYFALSNAGSLVALLAYPVLIEPRWNTHSQAWAWSLAYLGFAVLATTAAWISGPGETRTSWSTPPVAVVPAFRITRRHPWALWIGLAACPSALLLATTAVLTENVAPMPLLWVLPLSVYLLTFILCFDSSRWYRRAVFLPFLIPALACLAAATGPFRARDIGLVAPLLLTAFFVCCMACHGELVRLKPEPAAVTSFYLALSIGGALGGLFTAILAPHIFRAMFDFPLILVTSGAVLLTALWRERHLWTRTFQLPAWMFGVVAVVCLGGYLLRNLQHDLRNTIFTGRNFYGALRVQELKDDAGRPVRELMHGTITHGVQYLEPAWRNRPTTYYTAESGVGLAWRALKSRGPLKVGVIGLGAGTLATYGRAGDTIRFYEINPLVIDIARNQFSFLSDTPAHVDIVPGDARLTMQREPSQQFDLLVVDAFTGDAIPVHLLTKEAFRIYSRQLRPGGILAFHVSNRYINLPPVVRATGASAGFQSVLVEDEDNDRQEIYATSYVLSVQGTGVLGSALLRDRVTGIPPTPGISAWTDDFSNLWSVLELRENE